MTLAVPWWDLLMTSDRGLRGRLPARDIADIRYETTGHRRSISPKWARTVGLWGRVATPIEIEKIVGCSQKAVWRFAERWNLHFAGLRGHVSQFITAFKAYEYQLDCLEEERDWDPGSAGWHLNILPIEAKFYPILFQEFLDEQEMDAEELMESGTTYQLSERWANSDWLLRMPDSVLESIGGGDSGYIKKIHRRHGVKPRNPLKRKHLRVGEGG